MHSFGHTNHTKYLGTHIWKNIWAQISGEMFSLSACQGAKNGNFLPHDVVSERLWTAINLGEIPTRNYKEVETQGDSETFNT